MQIINCERMWVFMMAIVLCMASGVGHAKEARNSITFYNKSQEEAVVKLVGPSAQMVEVSKGSIRTVAAIAGSYHILVRYGDVPENYTYSKGDKFDVIESSNKYSAISVTLHKVVGGNYPTHPVSREEFDRTTLERQKPSSTPDTAPKKYSADQISGTIIVRGILLYPDGKPAKGRNVFILRAKRSSSGEVSAAISIGTDGVIENQGVPDAKGNFTIEVSREFFNEGEVLFCAQTPQRLMMPILTHGVPTEVQIPEGVAEIKLGEIIFHAQ